MSSTGKRVVFDALPQSPLRYLSYDAVVCIDIFDATTMLVTAVAQRRRVFPAASAAHGAELAATLDRPLLTGGDFDRGAPRGAAALARRSDADRPLVLFRRAGTELVVNSRHCRQAYVACLRNIEATAEALAGCERVAILVACCEGRLRCEDQLAAGRLAGALRRHGFTPGDVRTDDLIQRWSDADAGLVLLGTSADTLRRTGRQEDVDFVLDHVDDVALPCVYQGSEVVAALALVPSRTPWWPAAEHGGEAVAAATWP